MKPKARPIPVHAGKLSAAARAGNYKRNLGADLTSTIDYRRAGAADGTLPVSVERAGDAMIITIDFREPAQQRERESMPYSAGHLVVLAIVGIVLGSVVSSKEWSGAGALIGGGAAALLWFIVKKHRESRVDPWWRFTASPAGLLIEWQDRDGGPWAEKTYPRDRIRVVTAEGNANGEEGDRYQVCIYAPLPHVVPVRYFDVRRGEAEMIVNAIREGLRL